MRKFKNLCVNPIGSMGRLSCVFVVNLYLVTVCLMGLTNVLMKITVFWNGIQCTLVRTWI
jgi:hypothetical protein